MRQRRHPSERFTETPRDDRRETRGVEVKGVVFRVVMMISRGLGGLGFRV